METQSFSSGSENMHGHFVLDIISPLKIMGLLQLHSQNTRFLWGLSNAEPMDSNPVIFYIANTTERIISSLNKLISFVCRTKNWTTN